jgi:hypothetical protein
VTCPNTVSLRVIYLVFHRYQHNCSSSLDSIKLVYQHPLERLSAATDSYSYAIKPGTRSLSAYDASPRSLLPFITFFRSCRLWSVEVVGLLVPGEVANLRGVKD